MIHEESLLIHKDNDYQSEHHRDYVKSDDDDDDGIDNGQGGIYKNVIPTLNFPSPQLSVESMSLHLSAASLTDVQGGPYSHKSLSPDSHIYSSSPRNLSLPVCASQRVGSSLTSINK